MSGNNITIPQRHSDITLDPSAGDAQTFGNPASNMGGEGGFGVRIARDAKPVPKLGGFEFKQLKDLEEAMTQWEGTTGMKTNLSTVTSASQRSTIDTQLWTHATHGDALGMWCKRRYEHENIMIINNSSVTNNLTHRGGSPARFEYRWAFDPFCWRPILAALMDIYRMDPIYCDHNFDTAITQVEKLSLNWAFDMTKSGETKFFARVSEIFNLCNLRQGNPARPHLHLLFNALIKCITPKPNPTEIETGLTTTFKNKAKLQFKSWTSPDDFTDWPVLLMNDRRRESSATSVATNTTHLLTNSSSSEGNQNA